MPDLPITEPVEFDIDSIVAGLRKSRDVLRNVRYRGPVRPPPPRDAIVELMTLLTMALFPAHYGKLGGRDGSVTPGMIDDFVAGSLDRALPAIRGLLVSDLRAAYAGDPAASSHSEALPVYPGMTAIIHHRVAHILYRLGARFLARQISELAHSLTGIDIHPGARTGGGFFIDHGTGVVVGETAVIGSCVLPASRSEAHAPADRRQRLAHPQ